MSGGMRREVMRGVKGRHQEVGQSLIAMSWRSIGDFHGTLHHINQHVAP